jgi:hypothetical protein
LLKLNGGVVKHNLEVDVTGDVSHKPDLVVTGDVSQTRRRWCVVFFIILPRRERY